MKIIETKGLTKFYGKSRGIVEVDLSVESGDFFGFIGPNGAGKSTFIRTILGLISPTKGSAEVFGLDVCKRREEILSRVGFLPSETAFYSGMKVKDVLALSAGLRGKNCSKTAAELCERLELDPYKKVDKLSLGNRKKVGIVCALQHEAELYILDEPTSGLDPLMQKEFYSILKERNEKGATVFLSSHVLSEISRFCKNAAVIREGKILVSDSVEKLGHTGVKRVILRGVSDFKEFDGVRDVKRANDIVNFLYSGRPNSLIKELSAFDFNDINISDPELDEIFIHFYMKEGD